MVFSIQGNTVDRNAQQNGSGICENVSHTVNAVDRHAVAYSVGNGQIKNISMTEQSNALDCMHDQQAVFYENKMGTQSSAQYIVRRLTPTECARLQGFPDDWGHLGKKESFTPEEYRFWLDVRNTHSAITGKKVKEYTEAQMVRWYNGLHTDSAEYKMWGNGIALPCAEDVMGRIAKAMRRKHDE